MRARSQAHLRKLSHFEPGNEEALFTFVNSLVPKHLHVARKKTSSLGKLKYH